MRIGKGVTAIGPGVFHKCGSLNEIWISESVEAIGPVAFYECSSLTEITIPESVGAIAQHAFDGCSGLRKIKIGSGVTGIDSYAFKNCTELTSITVPYALTSILDGLPFENCDRLLQFKVSPLNTAFKSESGMLYTHNGDVLIAVPAGLKEVALPEETKIRGDNAFCKSH